MTKGNEQILIMDLKIQNLRSYLAEQKHLYDVTMESMELEKLYDDMDGLSNAIKEFEHSTEKGAKSELKALYRIRKETRGVIKTCEEQLAQIDQQIESISSDLEETRRLRSILYARIHGSPLAGEDPLAEDQETRCS